MWKKVILVLLISIVLLFLGAGCNNEVQMSPRMQQVTRMSAINVANMNKDCQAGNDESCKQGLAEAVRTLELIVEAM